MAMAQIAVIGAANVDIGGFPSHRPLAGDSTPGRVRLSPGGVGHNIACGAAALGLEVELVTALGADRYAEWIERDCAGKGVGLRHALRLEDAYTSTYLFIADERGDMLLAVNDMTIHDRMTSERLAPLIGALNGMDVIALDANLPADTLTYLAEVLHPPLIADCVSAAKADRLAGALPRLAALKPNRIEAQLLTGIEIDGEASARRAVEALLARGAKQVYLTLGEDGVCCGGADEGIFLLSCRPVRLLNATGAGDAFTAALVWARARGLSLVDSARAGMAAASIALESGHTVSPALNEETLCARMRGQSE